MANFKVIQIVDANTIKVEQRWFFRGVYGNLIKINSTIKDFKIPDADIFKKRLEYLLLNQSVDLRDPTEIVDNKLSCLVFLNGVDISTYFPDIKIKA
jgi:hypothetical protein